MNIPAVFQTSCDRWHKYFITAFQECCLCIVICALSRLKKFVKYFVARSSWNDKLRLLTIICCTMFTLEGGRCFNALFAEISLEYKHQWKVGKQHYSKPVRSIQAQQRLNNRLHVLSVVIVYHYFSYTRNVFRRNDFWLQWNNSHVIIP